MVFRLLICNLRDTQKGIDDLQKTFFEELALIISEKTELYSDFLFGMFVATVLVIAYHRFLGLRAVKKSYELRLEAQEETIKSLKLLVYERLDRIKTPEDLNKGIFAKLKKTFNIK